MPKDNTIELGELSNDAKSKFAMLKRILGILLLLLPWCCMIVVCMFLGSPTPGG